MRKYYDQDCNLGMLDGKTIAIIGFGSQGHAHAQNLKESGCKVVVGLRPDSKSAQSARDAGLEVYDVETAAEMGDFVMMLVPDEVSADIYNEQVAPHMKEGNVLMYAHGFNIHYQLVKPQEDIDVIMVAPKGPGHTVRSQYVEGKGVPSLIAVYQDYSGKAKDYALAYACGIGAGRAGILETSFREETETDLFGEQAVLCGGVCALMKAGFETLVDAGYQPEMAYFECIHEMKLIVEYVITEESKKGMKELLRRIQNGEFASEFVQEMSAGRQARFLTTRMKENEHLLCKTGQELRQMMSWLKK